jgi:hypothetical protein
LKEKNLMRTVRKALAWILLGLPCLAQAQYLSYQMSLFVGAVRPVQPGYFRNYYPPSREFGARLCVMFTERSGAEFDFASFMFHLDGAGLVRSLASSGTPDAAAADGRIRMDTATLSYLRFLTAAENGPWLYALAGIGLDRVEAEAIRITSRKTGSEERVDRFVDSMNGGYSPSLCAGLGLAVAVYGNISVFGEARVHVIITRGVTDAVSGGRAKDFIEFWTPAAGLKYSF